MRCMDLTTPASRKIDRLAEIDFALKDLLEVLHIWRDVTTPYTIEKYAEWDTLLDEKRALTA